jgi:hypothetical protein
MDMLLFSKDPKHPVFAVVRKKCKSALLVSLINRVGEQGSFQRILERLNLDNHDDLGIETLFYYLESFSKVNTLFNKAFINDFFPALF